jgi:hypothetical protein
MTLAGTSLFEKTDPEISFDKYLLMDCDSLYEQDFKVEIDGNEYRSIGECSFGGYYPLEPSTNL